MHDDIHFFIPQTNFVVDKITGTIQPSKTVDISITLSLLEYSFYSFIVRINTDSGEFAYEEIKIQPVLIDCGNNDITFELSTCYNNYQTIKWYYKSDDCVHIKTFEPEEIRCRESKISSPVSIITVIVCVIQILIFCCSILIYFQISHISVTSKTNPIYLIFISLGLLIISISDLLSFTLNNTNASCNARLYTYGLGSALVTSYINIILLEFNQVY